MEQLKSTSRTCKQDPTLALCGRFEDKTVSEGGHGLPQQILPARNFKTSGRHVQAVTRVQDDQCQCLMHHSTAFAAPLEGQTSRKAPAPARGSQQFFMPARFSSLPIPDSCWMILKVVYLSLSIFCRFQVVEHFESESMTVLATSQWPKGPRVTDVLLKP